MDKNEIAKAFCSTNRYPGENDENYAARCMALSDEIARKARIKGEAVHQAIEVWPNNPKDITAKPYAEYFGQWFKGEFHDVMHTEIMLADPVLGVAGRVDMIANHKQHGATVIDFKTQNVPQGPGVLR